MDLGKHPSGLIGKFHSSLIRNVLEDKETFSNGKMSMPEHTEHIGQSRKCIQINENTEFKLEYLDFEISSETSTDKMGGS